LLFSFNLELNIWNFLVQSFSSLFSLRLTLAEPWQKLLFFNLLALIKFKPFFQLINLNIQPFFVTPKTFTFDLKFVDCIFIRSSFVFESSVVFLMSNYDFFIVRLVPLRFLLQLHFKFSSELVSLFSETNFFGLRLFES
jgi:hypothetical protein